MNTEILTTIYCSKSRQTVEEWIAERAGSKARAEARERHRVATWAHINHLIELAAAEDAATKEAK